MLTETWIGGLSPRTDPNDATDPLNWVGGILPEPGDAIVIWPGSTLDLGNGSLFTITIDSTGTQVNPATLNFTSDNTFSPDNPNIFNGSTITTTGGQTIFNLSGPWFTMG